ncbi:MAG: glycine--tRNA ligase subunit beta [Candidatus Melainabacteria bacterium]|nr:glycine--tRNA ligase subunit beta [Candidatus Melainabacteria bacterium]
MPDLLFEIGTEELPPGSIINLTNQIKENIKSKLIQSYYSTSEEQFKTFFTPRRITIYIMNLPENQEIKTIEVKGPDKEKAFDKDGSPTQAAIGFAKKNNIEPKNLILKKINNTEYIFAVVKTGGQKTKDILAKVLADSLIETTGDKFMRWSNYNEKFSRPVRWILAILDKEIIKFSYSGIESSNHTYGHKFLSGKKIEIKLPSKYLETLRENKVVADFEERKNHINLLLIKESQNASGTLSEKYPDLLKTVTNLTEYPGILLCKFDKQYLLLPFCVIETVLEKHQKYFVLYDKSRKSILPNFIVITNGTEIENIKTKEQIIKGNEKVARARLNDAKFFFEEDLKLPFTFEEKIKALSKITFHKGLGSMQEKVLRIIELSKYIYQVLDHSFKKDLLVEDVTKTAELCKLDLSTHLVFEFPELQGEIGSIYAKAYNFNDNISCGIAEHYYPRYLGDKIPKSKTGFIVGIADKLDNIVCLFSINKIPTSSADPFALRRQAQSIIDNIYNFKSRINIDDLINFSINNIPNKNLKEKLIKDFFIQRFITLMENLSYEQDLITAVISVKNPLQDIISAKEKIDLLKRIFVIEKTDTYKSFLIAAKRLVRIVEANTNGNIERNNLTTDYERDLLKRFNELEKKQYQNYNDYITELITLIEPINIFFDKVLVNDPNPKIKQTRQALLKKGKDLFERICDFNQITERN